MLLFELLFTLLRKSLGSIVRAIFGWATLALFGEVSAANRTWLSVAVGAAAAWPFLVLGIVFPRQAALVLAFLPVPRGTPAALVRGVWIALAIATPAAVGWIMARSAGEGQRGSWWKRLSYGLPVTLGLGLAFLLACVVVPVGKISALAARKKEEHVPLAILPDDYDPTVQAFERALERGGLAVQRATPPWTTRTLGRILHLFAGSLLGAFLPKNLAFLRGKELQLTVYPNGVRILGSDRAAARAHAVITESATSTPALQCMSAEGQKIERRIRSIGEDGGRRESVDRRVRAAATALAHADLEFSDWQILYRELLQIVVASRGAAGLMEAAARRHGAERSRAG
jgi:hypothetical protein